ncbi:hypothetical protein LP316_12515 [Thalassotalea sp. LPB0316]|uniref:hypothetical protein n=1 Tax=Thalassotalea sp. LPB0316 TaxID=2769490 RepID=UPI0018668856|nr:hypothetical protein [Thalassotalea sp. LPB0316]QOL25117.1 hypothetical protein LP316_12515 [Thalassotalea sp. LPB0316]
MNAELIFIYDSHCPWSYAATPLVEAIAQAYPDIKLNLWHCGHYQGDQTLAQALVKNVEADSNKRFASKYVEPMPFEPDSTMAANLTAWANNKANHQALELLKLIQKSHFEDALPMSSKDELMAICQQLKMSPPAKVFKDDAFSKDAEFIMQDIFDLQEVIGTQSIPALLLAFDDNLVLLNHNLYLKKPSAIVEAVKLELNA